MSRNKEKERERMQVLARLGRETIIKNGTYDVDDTRKIDSDHPERYEKERAQEEEAEPAPATPAVPDEPISDEDASTLAAQILSTNFKVGMSQSDVDSFLNGMTDQ
ncbi:MAG: hypothetical protein K6E16_04810 [Lachnospiraceae bacterium]|nr:hypothetical protein [Lachnospiraceae bacterium]